MVRKATKFTPEILLGSTRRSAGKPSPDGQYILYSTRTYDFNTHKRTSEIRVLDHIKGHSHLIVGESRASEAHWLPKDRILYLKPDEETGRTDILATSIDAKEHVPIGTVEGQIQDLKVKALDNGTILLLGWGRADANGDLVNEKFTVASAHTMRLYDSLFVRHWDTWKDKLHNALFTAQLKPQNQSSPTDLSWVLSEWTSVHRQTRLESPIAPFGGSDNYDITEKGIVFVAKDPDRNPALHTTCRSYVVPLAKDKDNNYSIQSSEPLEIKVNDFEGAATSPVFSPDGNSIALLLMREDGYESDRNNVIIAKNVFGRPQLLTTPIKLKGDGSWDLSPSSLHWGHDDQILFFTAEFNGQVRLWRLELSGGEIEPMTRNGSVSSMAPLSNPPRMFVSGSSMVDDSWYAILSPEHPRELQVVSSHSRNGELYGLHASQSTSFWFEGHASTVHALMVLPPGFSWEDNKSNKKKWPLAFLVHGGPQGAWTDAWNTRWNPAVWASQGYVVVLPNPTGSTGYGQAFVDAIRKDWGGAPYQDLVKCFEHIEQHMTFVDTDRAIAAGASYGGYMMNWIQGHPLGRKFKAIVCHDGIMNNFAAQSSSDELYFGIHDLGGAPWEKPEIAKEWNKWDPARFVEHWATPQLIIHGERDFRLAMPEALAAFNVLQAKKIPSRLLVGKDENHWVLKEENGLVWHTVVFNWINRFVGLPPYREDEEAVIQPDEPFPVQPGGVKK